MSQNPIRPEYRICMKTSYSWCELLSKILEPEREVEAPTIPAPFSTVALPNYVFLNVREFIFLKTALAFSEIYFHLDIWKWDTSAFEFLPRTHLRFHRMIASSLNYSKISHGYENNRHHTVSILTMTTSHATELKISKKDQSKEGPWSGTRTYAGKGESVPFLRESWKTEDSIHLRLFQNANNT